MRVMQAPLVERERELEEFQRLRAAARRGGDHRAAFRRYEEGHRPLIERSQSNLFTGLVAPKSHAGIWARNTMARLPLISTLAGLERRLQPKTEPLPDYAQPRHSADPA